MEYKVKWIGELITLIDEYKELDGLDDAYRARQIELEIIEIMEKVK